jgi:hypothetical protein
MRTKTVKFGRLVLLTLVVLGILASPSFALVKNLAVVEAEWLPPGGTAGVDEIPMWAFVETNTCPTTTPVTWSVGPKIVVPTSEGLTINLLNCLPTGSEPVSIVIPGQAMPDGFAPVFVGNLVRSFVQEAAPGGSPQTYTWSSIQPGTYLYQSGTHPQVQVQMGLYGAVTKNYAEAGATPAEAYAGVPYTEQRDLFFSEVDPALHAAVAAGTYGTPAGPTSTLAYYPKYFLLHGWDGTAWVDVSIDTDPIPPACIDGGIGQGDRLLLRMYNAGLRELAPMLIGSHFDLVAEGGKKSPFARTQYQTLLVPGSTQDAIFTSGYEGDFKLIERRLNLTDAAATGGGMQTCITVGGVANTAPVVAITAPADGFSADQGVPINFTGTANDTEDGNISANLSWSSSINGAIGSSASFSTSTLSAGVHTITASVTDSGGLPGSASISITVVDTTNTAPTVAITAPSNGSSFNEGASINFTGTATDTQDGDISGSLSWSSSINGAIGSGASFSTSTLSAGVHTITASVTDSGGLPGSASITVTVKVVTNTAPAVTITNPSNGATFTQINVIPFAGTASDAEDGDISTNLSWTSSIQGAIGTGASFSRTLSVGTHTITASATDDGTPAPQLTGSASITVNVVAGAADTFTDVKAEYKTGPDRLRVDVVSSDTSGNRVMTVVMDQTGDGTFERNLGTASWLNGGRYRLNIQPFPNPNPTAASRVRITSDLGGTITVPVIID